MTSMIYALVACTMYGGIDGKTHDCQLMTGSAVYHRSLAECKRLAAVLDTNYPDGRYWHECYQKEIPNWTPAR